MKSKSIHIRSDHFLIPRFAYKWVALALILLCIVAQTYVLLDLSLLSNEGYFFTHKSNDYALRAALTNLYCDQPIKSFLSQNFLGDFIRLVLGGGEDIPMTKATEKDHSFHCAVIVSQLDDCSIENQDCLVFQILIVRTGITHRPGSLPSFNSKKIRFQIDDDHIGFYTLMILNSRISRGCYEPQFKLDSIRRNSHRIYHLFKLSLDSCQSCMKYFNSVCIMRTSHRQDNFKPACHGLEFETAVKNSSGIILLPIYQLSKFNKLIGENSKVHPIHQIISLEVIRIRDYVDKIVRDVKTDLNELKRMPKFDSTQKLDNIKQLIISYSNPGNLIQKRWAGEIPNCKYLLGNEQRICLKNKRSSTIFYSLISSAGACILLLSAIQFFIYRRNILNALNAKANYKSANFLKNISVRSSKPRVTLSLNDATNTAAAGQKNQMSNHPENIMMSYEGINGILNAQRPNQQINDKIKFATFPNCLRATNLVPHIPELVLPLSRLATMRRLTGLSQEEGKEVGNFN